MTEKTKNSNMRRVTALVVLVAMLFLAGCANLGGGPAGYLADEEGSPDENETCQGNDMPGGGGDFSGSDNIEKAFNFLVSSGYSKEMAAGIAGNFDTESVGAQPGVAEYGYESQFGWDVPDDQLRGWGIAQWTWERHAKVRKYVTDKLGREYYVSQYSSPTADEFYKEDPTREYELFEAQLEYLLKEMQEGYKASVYDPMMKSTTPEDAADIFVRKYEIPSDVDATSLVRQKKARDIYDKYADGAPEEGSGSEDSGDDSGSDGGGSGKYYWMTDTPVTMTSPYGYRIHPISGVRKMHDGIDYGGGGKLYAVTDGTIEDVSSKSTGFGNRVVLRLPDNSAVAYNHLASMDVSKGDKVKGGEVIGVMGTTGSSTGVHLHFNVYPPGKPLTKGGTVDPADWLEEIGFNHKNGKPNGKGNTGDPWDNGGGGGGNLGDDCPDGSGGDGSGSGNGGGDYIDADGDPDDPGSKNLHPNALKLKAVIEANFPEATDIGGWRPASGNGRNDHASGWALDIMTYKDSDMGDRISKFLEDHHEELNVDYQIWEQRIWNPAGGQNGGQNPAKWRKMEDRGSPTENHMDHVHVTVKNS